MVKETEDDTLQYYLRYCGRKKDAVVVCGGWSAVGFGGCAEFWDSFHDIKSVTQKWLASTRKPFCDVRWRHQNLYFFSLLWDVSRCWLLKTTRRSFPSPSDTRYYDNTVCVCREAKPLHKRKAKHTNYEILSCSIDNSAYLGMCLGMGNTAFTDEIGGHRCNAKCCQRRRSL